jgi:hypothetical protein
MDINKDCFFFYKKWYVFPNKIQFAIVASYIFIFLKIPLSIMYIC